MKKITQKLRKRLQWFLVLALLATWQYLPNPLQKNYFPSETKTCSKTENINSCKSSEKEKSFTLKKVLILSFEALRIS